MHTWRTIPTTNSISDPDSELGRMLAVLRFWFTKDLVGSVREPRCMQNTDLVRNTSRASLVNLTTRHSANSFEYACPFPQTSGECPKGLRLSNSSAIGKSKIPYHHQPRELRIRCP
jgi:hypothetical protein